VGVSQKLDEPVEPLRVPGSNWYKRRKLGSESEKKTRGIGEGLRKGDFPRFHYLRAWNRLNDKRAFKQVHG